MVSAYSFGSKHLDVPVGTHTFVWNPLHLTEAAKMNNKTSRKSHISRLQAVLAGAVLVASMGLMATTADATIVATVGGVPTSADGYETFNDCALGDTACTTSSGIIVTFGKDGQAVQGAASQYAAPFLSGNNGLNFGGQPNGADATTYLTSGATGSYSTAMVTLTFLGPTQYMGLLWGSVDTYNKLTFLNGTTKVGEFTGADVTALANGDQGAAGTFYVNINLDNSFTSVVATSSEYAFEFDNVAFSKTPIRVPEPGIWSMFGLGLLLIGSSYWLKGRRLA